MFAVSRIGVDRPVACVGLVERSLLCLLLTFYFYQINSLALLVPHRGGDPIYLFVLQRKSTFCCQPARAVIFDTVCFTPKVLK